MEKFEAYSELNNYERSVLPATNYWRVMNGIPIIPVPETDEHYKKYFDNRCYKLYKEKIEWEQRKKSGCQVNQTKETLNHPTEPQKPQKPLEKKAKELQKNLNKSSDLIKLSESPKQNMNQDTNQSQMTMF